MYHFFFATAEKILFDGNIHSVIVPGKAGSFEVLQNHAPIIALLKAGTVTVVDDSQQTRTWEISEGLFEVASNQATLLSF